MNFVPMRLKRQNGDLVAVLDSGQARCELALGMNDAGLEDRDVILGLRPEQIVLAAGEGNGSSSIRAEVQVTEPTGPDTLVFVQLHDTKVCCRLASCTVWVEMSVSISSLEILPSRYSNTSRIPIAFMLLGTLP